MIFHIFTELDKRYHPISTSRSFSSPQKEIVNPLVVTPCSHRPQPLATTNLFICLFWTFHIKGVIQYMAFRVWFLFLRIIYVVVHINILFLLMIQRQPFLTYCFWFLRVISIFLNERFSSWFMKFTFTFLTPYYERWRKIVSLLYLGFSFLS